MTSLLNSIFWQLLYPYQAHMYLWPHTLRCTLKYSLVCIILHQDLSELYDEYLTASSQWYYNLARTIAVARNCCIRPLGPNVSVLAPNELLEQYKTRPLQHKQSNRSYLPFFQVTSSAVTAGLARLSIRLRVASVLPSQSSSRAHMLSSTSTTLLFARWSLQFNL